MRYATGAALGTIGWCIFSASVAQAQVAPPPVAAPSSATDSDDQTLSKGLQEIVVTAQRRSENLQKAAVAVDVVSSAALQRAQVTQPTQLTNLVPALQVGSAGGTSATFFIRGVGTATANSYTDPAVAFNLDGVYIGRPNATTGYFYDLARLEVLKGPQGTLYGRNATGGAINLIPETPKIGNTSGYFNAALGDYNSANLQGAVNIAVSGNSALRVAGIYAKHDGFLSDGSNDLDARAIRAQYLLEATPNLKIRLSGDYFERFGKGTSSTIIATTPTNVFTNTTSIVPSGIGLNVGSSDPATGALLSTIFSPLAGRNLIPFTLQSSLNGRFWGTHAQIDWTTPIGILTILPAYRHGSIDDINVGGGFPVADIEKQRQASVEARLSGSVSGFDYIVGAFYYDEKTDASYIPYNQVLTAYQIFGTRTKSYATFGRLTYHVTDKLRAVGGIRYTKDKKSIDGESDVLLAVCTAATGQCPGAPLLPYTATAAAAISQLGLLAVAPNTYIQPGNPAAANTIYLLAPTIEDRKLSEGNVSYRAALEYDLTPHSLLYASFETGFRSGGFSFSSSRPQFGPEHIKAWTIGSKNRFFDNKLQLNVEGFLWKYKDQQVSHSGVDANGSATFFTENIGKSTNKGVEVEVQYLLTPTTLLNFDGQYLSAKYNSFSYTSPATLNPVLSRAGAPVYLPLVVGCPTSGPTGGLYTVNCSGKDALRSPKFTFTFGAQQTIKFGDSKVVIDGGTRYQTSNQTGFEQLAIERQKGYWTSNADITFYPKGDVFSIGAFINNIENKRVILYGVAFSTLSEIGTPSSDPRTYGIRMGMKF